MAKEWILNSVMNRFQLNFKRNVGPTSESIPKCSPKTIEEWEEYYCNNVRIRDHIFELGKKLYVKITEVFGGKVYYVFSSKINGKKEIVNKEVIEEIKNEVERLKNL